MSEQEFTHALDVYREYYLKYRTTGRSEYKIAYENAERWIQLYLGNISNQITSGRTFVDSFLRNYATASPDLDKLKTRFTRIRKEGPAIQDEYSTIKKINDNAEQPPDASQYYVKGGVLIALVGAIFVLSAI